MSKDTLVKYLCGVDIDVSTLTSGTVYKTIYNNTNKNIGINKLALHSMSTPGSSNTKCTFALARFQSDTAPTGGSVNSLIKMHTSNPTINVEIRTSSTGVSMNGAIIEAYFIEVPVKTGSDGQVISYNFDDEDGFILCPKQGLAIYADGDMIAGASLHGSIELNT